MINKPLSKREVKRYITDLQEQNSTLRIENEILKAQVIGLDEAQINTIEAVRIERDRRLKETDYIVMSDSQASAACVTAFQTYRQSLRDLPNQQDFDAADFTWPTKPAYETE